MKNTMLEKLNMELENCMINEKSFMIHLLYNGIGISNKIVPYEIIFDENGIYIESDECFKIEIENNFESIQYDEHENSYCISKGSSEIYFDFK